MALTGVNKRVLKVLEITKVEQVFLMFPTLGDAIEAFTNAGTAEGRIRPTGFILNSWSAFCADRRRSGRQEAACDFGMSESTGRSIAQAMRPLPDSSRIRLDAVNAGSGKKSGNGRVA